MITFNVALDPAYFVAGAVPPGHLIVVYGAQTNAFNAYPTVWFVVPVVLQTNPLSFPCEATPSAFVSDLPVGDGLPVPSSNHAISVGQTRSVGSNSVARVTSDSPATEISFYHGRGGGLSVGVGMGAGADAPVFAAALPGGELFQAIPGPYAVLFFSSALAATGTMIGSSRYGATSGAYLPASLVLQINLATLSGQGDATVTYTPDIGWTFPGVAPGWAKSYPATTDVLTLAIGPLPT